MRTQGGKEANSQESDDSSPRSSHSPVDHSRQMPSSSGQTQLCGWWCEGVFGWLRGGKQLGDGIGCAYPGLGKAKEAGEAKEAGVLPFQSMCGEREEGRPRGGGEPVGG